MREDRHAKFRGNLERRTRLRCVDHEFAARAIGEQAAQAQFANRTLGLARGTVAE